MVPAENPLDPCQGRWSEPGTDAPATVFGMLTGALDQEWPSDSPSLAGSRFELTIDVVASSWRVWEPRDPSACANAATWWLPDAHAEVRLPEGTSDAVGLAQVYVADGGSGEASMVRARSIDGEIGILPGHTPILGVLVEGDVVVSTESGERTATVVGRRRK